MKIVQFKNGKYAIRRFAIISMGYEYLDLTYDDLTIWWGRSSKYFIDCLSDNIKEVERFLEYLKDTGKIIK